MIQPVGDPVPGGGGGTPPRPPAEVTLASLKSSWTAVLDELERTSRTAWLVYHDARLASVADALVTLDFSDQVRFAPGVRFPLGGRQDHRAALVAAISAVTGWQVQVRTIPD